MKLKLKLKLSLAIIGAMLFFGVFAVVLVYTQTNKNFLLQEKNNLISLSSLKAHGVFNVFERSKNLVKIISSESIILEYVDNNPVLADENITKHLHHFNIGGLYSAIYIMAPDGTTLVSTNPAFVGKNYSFRDYFKKSMEGESWIDVAIGITSKKPGYYFSHPIISDEDEVMGVVIAKMSPELVHDFFLLGDDNDKTVKMFVDSEGVVIFSNDSSRIYKSLYTLSDDSIDFLKDKKRYSGMEIVSLGYDKLQKIELKNIEETEVFNFFDEKMDQKKVITITSIDNLPFFIITEIDLNQFVNTSGMISLYIGLLIFAAVFSAILFIIYFLNKFLRPLDILKEGAYHLSQENFDNELDIRTGDELEDLGNVFNQMSKKLKKAYLDLEKKVEKLKKFNKLMVGREIKLKELKNELDKYKK